MRESVAVSSHVEYCVPATMQSTYRIPEDFEMDKTKFGPLSGMTYESRLLSAWQHGLLPLRTGKKRVQLCATCGGPHWATQCN